MNRPDISGEFMLDEQFSRREFVALAGSGLIDATVRMIEQSH